MANARIQIFGVELYFGPEREEVPATEPIDKVLPLMAAALPLFFSRDKPRPSEREDFADNELDGPPPTHPWVLAAQTAWSKHQPIPVPVPADLFQSASLAATVDLLVREHNDRFWRGEDHRADTEHAPAPSQ